MEVMYKTKGVIILYPLPVFAIMLILLNGYCCGAAVLVETNTTFRCDGRLDECLLGDDLQLEFLINPYVSRLLQSGDDEPGKISSNTGNAELEAFENCKIAYKDCSSDPSGNPTHTGCGVYDVTNRSCRGAEPPK